jgi:Ankyrin repeats (many copies)/PQQ-like domain
MKTKDLLLKTRKGIFPICLFIISLLFLPSCVTLKIDGVKELNTKTEFQKLPDGVKELWQLPLKDEEVDQVVPVNDTKALVKTIEFDHYFTGIIYFYKYSSLSLVNLSNGNIDWIFSTINLEQKRQIILAVSPVILFSTSSEATTSYFALSPDNGKLVWKVQVSGSSFHYLTPDKKSMIISYIENGHWIAEKISVMDGEIRWKNTLSEITDKNIISCDFIPGNDINMVLGENILSLNSDNGKIKWQNSLKRGIGSWFGSADWIWLYNTHKVVSIDCASGKTSKEFEITPKNILSATVYKDFLIVSVNDSINKMPGIICFDINSGNVKWTLPVESYLKSAIYPDGENLYFTSRNEFYKIGISAGDINARIMLPDTMEARTLTFDNIQKINENFVIARENNIILISGTDNTVKNKYSFGIMGGFTPTYLQNKINEINLILSGGDIRITKTALDLSANETFYNLAKQNQSYVYSKTASTLASNSNAGFNDKMSALNQRMVASQGSYQQGRLQADQQFMNAGAQFGASVGNAIGMLIAMKVGKAVSQDIDYMEEKLNTSIQYQTNCMYGNLCIRPCYDNGWKLAVVDVNKPGYALIPMIPDLFPMRYSVTNSIVYSVVEKGDKMYLLVKAYKPLSAGQEAYKLRYFNHYNGKLNEWLMPKPSIVCYEISQIETRNIAPLTNQIQVKPRPSDKELIDGVFFMNPDKAEQMIREGADVNAIDEFGHTALMHACERGDYKMFKVLIKNGANPKLEDPEGLNAFDYIYMPANKRAPMTVQQMAKMVKTLKKRSSRFK